jgi:anti-sigma factor RsiW
MNNEQVVAEQLHLAQWQDRLNDVVDQALAPPETLQIHAHISNCVTCTREYRRLLDVDARLRKEFSAPVTPSPHFDKHLDAAIARLEQDKRGQARQREKDEYAVRLASLRKRSRELLRFQLGNVIAAIATLAAASTTILSMLSPVTTTLTSAVNNDLLAAQHIAWLPQGWSLLPILAVTVSAAIAATAIWVTQRVDRLPS